MNLEFGPKKQIMSVYTTPEDGHFGMEGTDKKSLHWDHCREQFAPKFLEAMVGFFFSHPHGRAINVATFVLKTEEILGFQTRKTPYEHSQFCLTNKSNILWFEPSSFWRECWMKRSAITILLRAGMAYNLDEPNYEEALFTEKYGSQTKPAFMRFLYGFTKYIGEVPPCIGSVQKEGWHSTFSVLDNPGVRKLLVVPDGEKYDPCFIGLDSLWS